MSRVFITGASGYIGGEMLAQMQDDPNRYSSLTVYCVVRQDKHGEEIKKLGYTPVKLDLSDANAIKKCIVERKIDVLVEFTDPIGRDIAIPAIEALAEVGPGKTIITSSGAKLFSVFGGFDTSKTLEDDDPTLLDQMKNSKAALSPCVLAHKSYVEILETARKLGVHVQIVTPPVVYGKSRSFGNPLTKQVVEVVRLAQAMHSLPLMPTTDTQPQDWALCHIHDSASGYLACLNAAIAGTPIADGVYFEENGSFSWEIMYKGILRGLGEKETLFKANDDDVKKAAGILGVPVELAAFLFAGRANIRGRNLRKIGWVPKYGVDHLYGELEQEAKYISEHL